MCVECSYAETEQLHDQRLSIGEPEELPERGEPEEEVGREPHGRRPPTHDQVIAAQEIFETDRPLLGFQIDAQRDLWRTTDTTITAAAPYTTEAVPIQEAPNGGTVEFHPTTFDEREEL